MSVIGPRPGLWNQDVLTAERDKYGANDVKPGLTGWAQINGRDELDISDKAKLDGEYVKNMSFVMDAKVFLPFILYNFLTFFTRSESSVLWGYSILLSLIPVVLGYFIVYKRGRESYDTRGIRNKTNRIYEVVNIVY